MREMTTERGQEVKKKDWNFQACIGMLKTNMLGIRQLNPVKHSVDLGYLYHSLYEVALENHRSSELVNIFLHVSIAGHA